MSTSQPLLTAPSTTFTSSFNPLTHIPPRYDIEGYLKPPRKSKADINILSEMDSIKIPWKETATNPSGAHTLRELQAKRRLERIPDISYDLDNDGYVGGRDFVIAKRFDVDGDGKLNEQEKKAAYEGLANGVENNYIWNIDNQGATRPFQRFTGKASDIKKLFNKDGPLLTEVKTSTVPFRRYMQVRGKIIEAEDFQPVRDTYPEHPLSKHKSKVKTFRELQSLRKQNMINTINTNIHNWEQKNPRNTQNDNYIPTVDHSKKPLHINVNEIRDEKHRAARIKVGLDEYESGIGMEKKHPSLEYVYDPKNKTKGDIDMQFHKENQIQSEALANSVHKDEVTRLNEREDEIFAKLYHEEDGLTYSKIKDKIRKETNENNIKTFSNQTLGVHGHELPKFAESTSMYEFWKHKDGYCNDPKFKSHVEYKESIKYWKPSEELYLNEHRDELPQSKDPFKTEYHPIQAKEEKLILKVNNINHFKNFDPKKTATIESLEANPPKHIYRWTTLVNQFAPNKFKKGRFFDVLPKEEDNENEYKNEALAYDPFANDYRNNMLAMIKGEINKTKLDMERAELCKTAKDALYQKFSNKEPPKNLIPKAAIARSKAF